MIFILISFLSLESGCSLNTVITSEVSCCRIDNALLGAKELPPVLLCQVDISEGVILRRTSGKNRHHKTPFECRRLKKAPC